MNRKPSILSKEELVKIQLGSAPSAVQCSDGERTNLGYALRRGPIVKKNLDYFQVGIPRRPRERGFSVLSMSRRIR